MSATVAIWLEEFLNYEIEHIEVSIENEKIWKDGSSSNKERGMHQENIDLYNEYLEILKQIKEEYNV